MSSAFSHSLGRKQNDRFGEGPPEKRTVFCREEFRAPGGVRKSPKNEPAVTEAVGYGD